MKIISCKFKDKIENENGHFYVIRQSETKNQYIIPSHQIQFNSDNLLNNTYNFFVERNDKTGKEFLSLIHPKYSIGEICKFQIINIVKIEQEDYFELKSQYHAPLRVKALPWQLEFKDLHCRIKTYKRGYPILQNVDTRNSKWSIGEIKEFRVKGFSYYEKNDKIINTIKLEIDEENIIFVNAGKWHIENIWTFETIYCEIIGLTFNGLPKLIVKDSRHPKYELGKIYNFIVKSFKVKKGKNNNEYNVIELADETDITYEVQAIPNQELKIQIGQTIECEVKDINYNLSLKQVNFEDPFFYEFDDIVKDRVIKDKYFTPYLNDDNYANSKLKSQYEQKSGFWVFTFCNSILKKIKAECTIRQDLKEYIIINNVHTNFEKWILHKGILRAIHDVEERKITKQKINQILKINEAENTTLQYLSNFKYDNFISKINTEFDFVHLYYFLRFSNLSKVELCKIIEKLSEFLNQKKELDSENYFFVKKIIYHINKAYSYIYKNYQDKNYLILNKTANYDSGSEMWTYLSWQYIQYILYKIIDEIEFSNLVLSKINRISTFFSESLEKKSSLLYNAFYIVSNIDLEHRCILEVNNNELIINVDNLLNNPNIEEIQDFSKGEYSIKVIEKKTRGFNVYLNKTKGFLPTQNVADNKLKYINKESLDWTINAELTLFSIDFNYFIAKQLAENSENYLSINNQEKSFAAEGEIIFGTIKRTTEFGFFVSTIYGDGLVHISQISNYYFNKFFIEQTFKIGMRLPFYVLSHSGEKLSLSLSKLVGTKYEKKYFEIIRFYDIENEVENSDERDEYDIEARIELEKGYIFETYALFQTKLSNKTKYIKFAKIFFSNTFNARSYLLNIYLEYFASLEKLDKLLEDYSFEKYTLYRNDILVIKNKVQLKTLENFPESKNLLFFIDILSLFNSKEDDDIEKLFHLTKKPIEENDLMLKTVAKNALANNLIVSELTNSEEQNDLNNFTFNNLKRIREFISQGVLSVKESQQNKLKKELEEKIAYWKGKIALDEGEKMEFKASLFTPIPSNEKNKVIESLKKQLKSSSNEIAKTKLSERIAEIENEAKNVKNIDKILIHSSFKTLCAFANTNGGHLLLGVMDDKKIFGLEQDYNCFNDKKDRDEFGKRFDELLKEYFGDSFSSLLLEKEFLKFPEGDVLIIEVKKSDEEIFILKNEKGDKEENLYVRNLSSSIKLKGIELAKFIKNRVKQNIQNNIA